MGRVSRIQISFTRFCFNHNDTTYDNRQDAISIPFRFFVHRVVVVNLPP